MFDQPATPRRGFLARMSAAAAAFAVPVSVRGLADGPLRGAGITGAPGDWDNSWMEKLHVQAKQVFDAPSLDDGNAIHYAGNYLNAMIGGYGIAPDQVRAVVVLRGSAVSLAVGDAMWKAYRLGEVAEVTDKATSAPAERNLWANGDAANGISVDDSVVTLQNRGGILLACNNAMNHLASKLAKRTGKEQPAVLADLKRGLLPGVVVVPAALAALGRAQQQGCSYVYVG